MSYKRNNRLKELSKAKIRDTRNAVINEMVGYNGESKGFLISQQVEFEEDGQTTRMFLRGGMTISNVEGLISLRKALDKAIIKAGGELPECIEVKGLRREKVSESKDSETVEDSEDEDLDAESLFGDVPHADSLNNLESEEGDSDWEDSEDESDQEEESDSSDWEDSEEEDSEEDSSDHEEGDEENYEEEVDYETGSDEEWEC